jgi:hypothetical protein
VFDEVITGFPRRSGCRSGRACADLAVAKAIAGGIALSAVTGSRSVMAPIADGRQRDVQRQPHRDGRRGRDAQPPRGAPGAPVSGLDRLGCERLAAALRAASRGDGPAARADRPRPSTSPRHPLVRDRTGDPAARLAGSSRLLATKSTRRRAACGTSRRPRRRDIDATAEAAAAAAGETLRWPADFGSGAWITDAWTYRGLPAIVLENDASDDGAPNARGQDRGVRVQGRRP